MFNFAFPACRAAQTSPVCSRINLPQFPSFHFHATLPPAFGAQQIGVCSWPPRLPRQVPRPQASHTLRLQQVTLLSTTGVLLQLRPNYSLKRTAAYRRLCYHAVTRQRPLSSSVRRYMQRIYIDFSVFAPFGAVGVIDGYMECSATPRAGENISFTSPKPGVPPVVVPGFTGFVNVEHVVHSANAGGPVALSLATVTLTDNEYVSLLAKFMEDGFGLGFTPHPNWLGSA